MPSIDGLRYIPYTEFKETGGRIVFAQSLPLILTLLAIGAGILFNNKGLSDLKADVKDLKSELKGDIGSLRTEIKEDIASLRTELKEDIASLRTEVKQDIARIDTRLNMMQSDLQRFYELKGHLEGRIDEIAKRVAA